MTREIARGLVSSTLLMRIYDDGSFGIKPGIGRESAPDRLVSFDHDADSMRRKSATGRGGAALLTGGVSLLASNNRGVIYVTVGGERTGLQTFTTRNPSGTLLTSVRELKAAANHVLAAAPSAPPPRSPADDVEAIRRLADLFKAGDITAKEYEAGKAKILGT